MFQINEETKAFVKKECARYETRESAIIPSLYKVQEQNKGWVPEEAITQLSQVMDIPEARINEVFHFYTMFNKEPVGRHHVQVCCNVACAMAGTREMLQEFLHDHDVEKDEMTKDGKFTFSAVECLGACDKAPMMQVNEKYHENLTVESVKKLLKELK